MGRAVARTGVGAAAVVPAALLLLLLLLRCLELGRAG